MPYQITSHATRRPRCVRWGRAQRSTTLCYARRCRCRCLCLAQWRGDGKSGHTPSSAQHRRSVGSPGGTILIDKGASLEDTHLSLRIRNAGRVRRRTVSDPSRRVQAAGCTSIEYASDHRDPAHRHPGSPNRRGWEPVFCVSSECVPGAALLLVSWGFPICMYYVACPPIRLRRNFTCDHTRVVKLN